MSAAAVSRRASRKGAFWKNIDDAMRTHGWPRDKTSFVRFLREWVDEKFPHGEFIGIDQIANANNIATVLDLVEYMRRKREEPRTMDSVEAMRSLVACLTMDPDMALLQEALAR